MKNEEVLIWNRAADGLPGLDAPRLGDRALADLLRVHNEVMSGGMLFMAEMLDSARIRAAVSGAQFLGLSDVGRILGRVSSSSSAADLDALEDEYTLVVPSDEVLVRAFVHKFRDFPEQFASGSSRDSRDVAK